MEPHRTSVSLSHILLAPARVLKRRWWLALLSIPLGIAAASWWLTEPLTDHGAPVLSSTTVPVPITGDEKKAVAKAPLVWPETRLDGMPAKVLNLEALLVAAERLNTVGSYTATFRKRERIKGNLGPEQTLAMKVRQKPFAIYCKFLKPTEGKEVVYAEGHHDNKLIVHAGGMSRFLLPRVALAPDHPLALADARHPLTEAGISNLTTRLIGYRRLDLNDPEAETALDRVVDSEGRAWLRSVHTHPKQNPDRPFARIEVLYDPKTFLPMDIRSFDWPKSGETGELSMAEHYSYANLDLDASLNALDFDPANPAYSFHRY